MVANAESVVSPRAVPAWLLSAALHLVLIILLGLLVRPSRPLITAANDRPVGITLFEQAAVTPQYFDESDSDGDSGSADAEVATSTELTVEMPNDEEMRALESAEFALPQASVVTPPLDSLVAQPKLSSGGKARLFPNQGVAEILAEEARRRKGRKALGPPANVSLFGSAPASGRTFIFAIDRSQSMGRGGLGALSVAAVEFQRALAELKPSHRFQILAYNHKRVFLGDDKWVPATDQNKNGVAKFMHGLAAFGGTDHQLALSSALYRHPDVIFLLTDGGDPALSASQLDQIRKRAGGRTAVHCIQFGARPWQGGEPFMKRLAEQTGGSYRYVDLSRWKSD